MSRRRRIDITSQKKLVWGQQFDFVRLENESYRLGLWFVFLCGITGWQLYVDTIIGTRLEMIKRNRVGKDMGRQWRRIMALCSCWVLVLDTLQWFITWRLYQPNGPNIIHSARPPGLPDRSLYLSTLHIQHSTLGKCKIFLAPTGAQGVSMLSVRLCVRDIIHKIACK